MANVTYTYDGTGLRASETTSAGTQQFTWDFSQPIPLLVSDGTNSYIYGPGGIPIEQIDSSGNVTYLHQDQLGSTRMLTDPSGNVTATYSYSPYGSVTSKTGTGSTPLGFAGQYTDAQTGLIYMRTRYCDPATGQFLTVDPAVILTAERYSYAADAPLNFVDPAGLCDLVAARVTMGPDNIVVISGCVFVVGGGCVILGADNTTGQHCVGLRVGVGVGASASRFTYSTAPQNLPGWSASLAGGIQPRGGAINLSRATNQVYSGGGWFAGEKGAITYGYTWIVPPYPVTVPAGPPVGGFSE